MSQLLHEIPVPYILNICIYIITVYMFLHLGFPYTSWPQSFLASNYEQRRIKISLLQLLLFLQLH